MSTEFRASRRPVSLTPTKALAGSPTTVYRQTVGKVHAVAVVDGVPNIATMCGRDADPQPEAWSDVPAHDRCVSCTRSVDLQS